MTMKGASMATKNQEISEEALNAYIPQEIEDGTN